MKTKPVLLIYLLFVILILVTGLNMYGCGDIDQPKATNIVAPVPVAPPDGNTVSQPFTFRWTGTADRLEIDYTGSFNPPVYSKIVVGNQYNMPADTLAHNTYYFWRIGLTVGATTYWSKETWLFKTEK